MLCIVLLSSIPHLVLILYNIINYSFLTLRMRKSTFKINGSLMCAHSRAWIYMTLLLNNWCSMHITLALSFVLPSLFWWARNCSRPVWPTMSSRKLLRYCCYWRLLKFLTCFDISLIQYLLLILIIVILILTHKIFGCTSITGKVIQSCKSFWSSKKWSIF